MVVNNPVSTSFQNMFQKPFVICSQIVCFSALICCYINCPWRFPLRFAYFTSPLSSRRDRLPAVKSIIQLLSSVSHDSWKHIEKVTHNSATINHFQKCWQHITAFFCFRLAFHTTINQLSENQHLVSFPRNNEAMRSTKISNLMITVPGLYHMQFYRRSTTSISHRNLILYEKNVSTSIELLQIKSIHAYLAKTWTASTLSSTSTWIIPAGSVQI